MRSPQPSSISPWAPAAGRFCARAQFPHTKSLWCFSGKPTVGIKMVRMRRRVSSKQPNWMLRALLLVFLALTLATMGWCYWVYVQIETCANQDQAAPSDAIGVFGAAEYDGRPSPVYRARLDHALDLYNRGIAPLIITLGGNGAAHCCNRPGKWVASAGNRQRRDSPVPDSRYLRRRGPERTYLAARHRTDSVSYTHLTLPTI